MIRLVVKLRRWSDAGADRVLADCGAIDGGKRLRDIGLLRALAPEDRADRVLAALRAHPAVRRAGVEHEAKSWSVVAYQATSSEGVAVDETKTTNGTDRTFPFSFYVENPTCVYAFVNGVQAAPVTRGNPWSTLVPGDYTVSQNADKIGGSITFNVAPAPGTLRITKTLVPLLPHSWHESRHAIGRAKVTPIVDAATRVAVTDSGLMPHEDLPDLPSGQRWHTALDAEFSGDGTTTAFAFTFPASNDPSMVKGYVNGALAPCTVALRSPWYLGGTATFASPPPPGAVVRIQGDADRCDEAFYFDGTMSSSYLVRNASHGTAVAGLMWARPGNGIGTVGVAPELVPCFVATAGTNGKFTALDLAEALMVAAARTDEIVNGTAHGLGARVVNCSWGEDRNYPERFAEDSAIWNPAIDFAVARDVVVVVAAGNDGADLDAVAVPPFDHPKAFCVGGIQEDDGIVYWPRHDVGTWTGYSRFGSRVDITAAASYTWSPGMAYSETNWAPTWDPKEYWNFGGTSGAAPIVTAALARVRATNPDLTADETMALARETGDGSRNPGNYDRWFPNAKILNLAKAVAKAAALRVPGSVHPHVQFFKPGPYTRLVTDYGNPTDGPWTYTAPGGTTTLTGPVDIEIAAYSTDPGASVEIQVGGVSKYAGPSARLTATAAYDGATANPVRLIGRDGTGTIVSDETFSDVLVTSLESVGIMAAASDSTTSTDSNQIEVKSPAFAAVTDATASTDSTSCVLALASTVAVPFLVAASIVAAVLYDTASADTGSFADTVTIARKAVHTDAASFADTIAIGLGCGAADTGSFSDVAAARIGIYSAKGDANTFADSVGATLLLVSSGADATSSSDSNAIEQTFPATVEVSDATTTQDTNATLAAIGQSDATGSVDTAYAYVGIISSTADFTSQIETTAAAVYTKPPVDVEPIEAVADPVKVGMIAGEGPVGVVAQSVPVGMVYRRNGMQIGKCWQGCDFPVFFPKEKDAIGQAVDLSGATLLCSAKIGTEIVAASATSVDASAGTGQAVFSAAQTATWPTGVEISFDGVYRLANGRTYPAGTGKFWVADPITPTP